MRWPWQKRQQEAKADTEQAQKQYEWAVQNRSTVNSLVHRLVYHGEQNEIIEKINSIVRGGHK